MKKPVLALLILLFLLGGLAFWLVGSTDAKHLEQQEIVQEIPDTFER
jgi:hypothetical protein